MFKYLLFFVLWVIHMDAGSADVNITDAKARLARGRIALSGEFLYQLCQSKPNDNFVTSATSILVPLAQIALYAKNNSKVLKELLNVLNLNNKDEIKRVSKEDTASYKNQQLVQFDLASEYFFNQNFELNPKFRETSLDLFEAGGQNVNFGNQQQAAKIINDYVSNKTHDRIKDLVSPDSLGPSTVVVLVNAIYFLGNWVHQFNPNATRKRNFTKRNGNVVQLDTMYQESNFNYAENIQGLKIQALEMPYKNSNFSFLVILPQSGQFENTIQTLRDPSAMEKVINNLFSARVRVYLPKMLIETSMDMGEMLKKRNVSAMFDPSSDGFKGILKNNQKLFISSAMQKAFIRCDETGTEAAAATALIAFGTTSVAEPPRVFIFVANRPYLFYLLFKRVPVFCGAFVGAK